VRIEEPETMAKSRKKAPKAEAAKKAGAKSNVKAKAPPPAGKARGSASPSSRKGAGSTKKAISRKPVAKVAVFLGLSTLDSAAGAAAVAAPAWACPAAGTPDLEDRVLSFLQTQALARVAASPGLAINSVWFTLDEVRSGVDPSIPAGRYVAVLKLTLPGQGCSTFATVSTGDIFRALLRGE
jgi:hypothetical protein